jgi:polyferredoxin
MTPIPLIEAKKTVNRPFTLSDILTWPVVGPFLRWRHARRTLQVITMVFAGFVVFDGLVGPQQAPKNLATVSVWIHYRGLVVLALLVVGNLFCMTCPFMLPREIGRWLGAKLGVQGNVPRPLRNKWLAAILLAAFFFLYELFDLWASPWLTAWIIVGYFLTALVVDTFFQGAAFCKYVCPVGQFNFYSSLSSPTEIKIREAKVCAACRTKDCIAGNRRTAQRGCELWLFQEQKSGNMDCTFCLDCVQACPYNNVGIMARVPTQELWTDPRRSGIGRFSQRWDMVALIVVLTFGAYLNAFGMITPVYALQQKLARWLDTPAETPGLLLIFFTGFVIIPAAVLSVTGFLSRLLSGQTNEPLSAMIRRFVFALAPLGFSMWLAHYVFHFLTGGLTLIPVMQSFLNDSGLNVGQPRWELGPVIPAAWLFPLQAILLYVGLFGSLAAGAQVAINSYQERGIALRAFLPWGLLLLLMLGAALWIMFQPMEMRGTFFLGV